MPEINVIPQQVQPNFANETGFAKSVQLGQLDDQVFQVDNSNAVDPSTKDDEVASGINAHKNANKAKKRKSKEQQNKNVKHVESSEDSKKVQEQDHRGKRISKQTEIRLTQISQQTSRDLNIIIQERSNALFPGSEKKYEKCFDSLDKASMQGTLGADILEEALKDFEDIAEQHNSLQIAINVWELKLANLKKVSQELRQRKSQDSSLDDTNDYNHLQHQISQLEDNIELLLNKQKDIMNANGARIEDSYKLAPLLRDVTAQAAGKITLPPKNLNALLLDELLPLNGDPLKTFNCLTQGLIEKLSQNPSLHRSAVEHFYDNVAVLKHCLRFELKCCPDPRVATAIIDACRTVEKLDSVQNVHEVGLLQMCNYFKN